MIFIGLETVEVVFRGLRSLLVIHDPLRSGAELVFDEKFGLSEEQVANLVSSKDKLDVFAERRRPSREMPNYGPFGVEGYNGL